jgi:hypothetical protein
MALMIQKLTDKTQPGLQSITPPPGWLTIDQLAKLEQQKENDDLKQFEQSVSHFLPMAAKRTQDLIDLLDRRLNIKVPISYLTIENATTFHATMLLDQGDYLSPEMQAARILTEKDKQKNSDFDMHYTFTVGTEYMQRSSVTANANSYQLKNIPEFEKNLQVELVYLNQAV